MAAIDSGRHGAPPRTFFLNDPVIRGVFYQIVVAILVVVFFVWIIQNTAQNLAAQNKTTGFDFLTKTAGFDISFSLFHWDRTSFYWEAFLVGLTNTLLVALIGWMYHVIAHKPGGQPIGALEWAAAKAVRKVRALMPRARTA